jgi:hypothetical protein
MRVSTRAALLGALLSLGFGCAKAVLIDGSDPTGGSSKGGSTGTGGSSETGGSTGTGGSSETGGSTGTGGNVSGTGGRVSTGGSTGTGGRATGGSNGTGGSSTGGSTGTGGTGTSCTFTQSSTPSTKIPTVGIVTWSTTLSSPTSASIKFGLDTNYGMTAPLTSVTSSNRTLLLGMKASKMYHYQITATNSSGTCTSGDYTIMTGALPNGGALPTIPPTTNNKAALWGGFLVVGSYMGSTNQSFILDADGDFVWWYADGSDGCGTRMSYDGQYMWINNGNVPGTNPSTTHVHRVTMDGLTDTDFSTPFANMSHQVTPLPDGSVAFYAYNTNTCDDIKIFPANGTPTTTATTLVNSRAAHGGTAACHVNNIEYSSMDDTLVFSDLDNGCLTKVSRTTGATVWILNGGANGIKSSFTGDVWKGGEHGFHILGLDDFVIFNNNSAMDPTGGGSLAGDNSGSLAIEMKLNLTAMTATKSWSYKASPAISVGVLGDVQRMTTAGPSGAGNGNTIVNFGTGDIIQEIDSNGTVLQQFKSQYPVGFMEKRATLYGPPTR